MTATHLSTSDPTAPAPRSTPALGARASGLALAGGGALFAVGNLLHPLQHSDAAYRATTWEAAHVAIVVSIVPLLLGLPHLVGRLRERGATTSATLAHVLLTIGFLGIAATTLPEAFFAPELGHAAMERLGDTGFGVVGGMLSLAWLPGLLALSLAARKAALAPAPLRWSFTVGAVAMLTIGSGTTKVAGAAIIASTAVVGLAFAALGARIADDR